MNGALLLYIVAHVALSAIALMQAARLYAPRWRLGLHALGRGAGCAGMILLAQEAVIPEVSSLWRFVFPVLIAEALIDGAWDLRIGLPRQLAALGDTVEPREARRLLFGSLTLGVLVSIPYFVLNYRVAWPVE